MSDIPKHSQEDWSSASEQLFRAARSEHAPSAADRERVRRALAKRVAEASSLPGSSVSAGSAGSMLSRWLMFGLGASLVVVATISVKRTNDAAALRRERPAVVVESVAPKPAAEVQSRQPDVELPPQLSPQSELSRSDSRAPARAARRVRARATTATPDSSVRQPVTAEPVSVLANADADYSARAGGIQTEPAPTRAAVAQAASASDARPTVRAQDTGEPERRAARVESTSSSEPQPSAAQAALDPEPLAVRVPAAKPHPTAARAASAEPLQTEDARAELVFVRRIQAALSAGESAEVLALSAQHARQWPEGTFVQEREGLRAIALCDTSARDAGARARAFLTRFPRTPLRPRVRDACKLQLKATPSQ